MPPTSLMVRDSGSGSSVLSIFLTRILPVILGILVLCFLIAAMNQLVELYRRVLARRAKLAMISPFHLLPRRTPRMSVTSSVRTLLPINSRGRLPELGRESQDPDAGNSIQPLALAHTRFHPIQSMYPYELFYPTRSSISEGGNSASLPPYTVIAGSMPPDYRSHHGLEPPRTLMFP